MSGDLVLDRLSADEDLVLVVMTRKNVYTTGVPYREALVVRPGATLEWIHCDFLAHVGADERG